MQRSNSKKLLLFNVSLVACGGGGSTNNTYGSTGVFLDAQVVNIGYSTETQGDVTDPRGEYNYLPGETVTFSSGDLELPAVTASGIVTPLDFAGTTDIYDPMVVNISRLIGYALRS